MRCTSLLLLIFCATAAVRESFGAVDFFHLDEQEGRWQLIDPEGNPFFLRGLNHFGDGTHMPWNLEESWGDAASWRRGLPDRLREWGFNYLPPSIGPSHIDPAKTGGAKERSKLVTRVPEWSASDFSEVDFPFTIFLEYPMQYMAGPNLPDVFSQEFRDAVDERCREVCLPLKDNPNLIGYHFCHNPPWHPRTPSYDLWIDNITKPGTAGRKEWVELMRRIYGTIDRWRETYGVPIESWEEIETLDDPLRGYVSNERMLEDRDAFMRRICEEWYRVYSEAVRRYDSNHLILGDRNTLHLQPLPAYAIEIMKRYIDVLSVNVMGPPDTVYSLLERATRNWDGPIHLADTGAGIYEPGLLRSGYQAKDLGEFEEVYSGLMQMSIDHPQIVGFGWCGFFETPPPGARSGLVDVRTGEPIRERLEIMKKWNAWIRERETGME